MHQTVRAAAVFRLTYAAQTGEAFGFDVKKYYAKDIIIYNKDVRSAAVSV